MGKPEKPTVEVLSEPQAWAIWTAFPKERRYVVKNDLAIKDFDGRMRILRLKSEVTSAGPA